MSQVIYLDHNATTPVFPEVVEAIRACWAEPCLNPASQHSFGRHARRVLERARDRIAELLGAGPRDRVIFTSGGTEANNLAVRGLLRRAGCVSARSPHLITSPIEHPSIATLADHLAKTGVNVDHLPVDQTGVLSTNQLAPLLRPSTGLVTAMLANNETGVIQPVAELAKICNAHNVPLHTDASQAAGKLRLNFSQLGAAAMTIAAHKFGGPLGIGALLIRGDVDLDPQLLGGFQQAGTRPGTESVALAAGMHMALELWETHRHEWTTHLDIVRREFERGVFFPETSDGEIIGDWNGEPRLQLKTCKPVIIAENADRLPTTSNIAFVGIDRQQLFLALDQAGIACSTGSACASGSSEPSPAHLAMGLEPAVISSALRFSFGLSNTLEDVEEAAARIIAVCNSFSR